jgi:hypothetical protein
MSFSLQGERDIARRLNPANIGKGWFRPARCTRGSGDRFGIPNPRESGSVIGADRRRRGPLVCCRKACHTAKRRLGYSTRRLCWATSAQGRCHLQEALYLPTFSHLLIVNKLLSLSLSLSIYLSLSLSLRGLSLSERERERERESEREREREREVY